MTAASNALGAVYLGRQRTRFDVWAPRARHVSVILMEGAAERSIALARDARGRFRAEVDGAPPGTRYLFELDGQTRRPDPASRLQPEGVHGPSEVVDPDFDWTDRTFRPHGMGESVFYEVHVGTFTPEGTFDALVPHLSQLAELGVTTLELMPVAQFPGARGWGYDGVYPFACQTSYGGPAGLKRLVDACHGHGLSVALDVVHNHLGPEGNYLRDFGPYFHARGHTPWGEAVNFDGRGSDEVREYFIQSALAWVLDFHIDALRLDAIHAIVDSSAEPFLRELAERLHAAAEAQGRRVHVIAETHHNDPRTVRSRALGGLGHDAQWCDDFHHAVHANLTGERCGYYADFGDLQQLAEAYRGGFVLAGQYSHYRGRRHGSPAHGCTGERFVVYTLNHDQVGNRPRGDRLTGQLSFEQEKLLACLLLASPFVPLLFMGQEYGERAPFQFFTDFGDPDLGAAVRQGRRRELTAFGFPDEGVPDPQDPKTFVDSRLDRERASTEQGQWLWALHRELLRLRRERPALRALDRDRSWTTLDGSHSLLTLERRGGSDRVLCAFAFGGGAELTLPPQAHAWQPLLHTGAAAWGGSVAAWQATLAPGGRLELPPWSCAMLEATPDAGGADAR